MIVAVHAFTGAALSRLCRTPWQAFALGFASHLVADAMPHRDLDVPTEGALAAVALGCLGLAHGLDSCEFAGALGAVAPDLENIVARALGISDEKLLLPTHNRYHGAKLDNVAGQVALALCCVAVLAWPTK
jgi:hypothetical protein